MILHLSHIFLTEGRTFIIQFLSVMRSLYQHVQPQTVVCRKQFVLLLIAIGDTTTVEVIDGKFDLNLVAGKDLDVVHTHLP